MASITSRKGGKIGKGGIENVTTTDNGNRPSFLPETAPLNAVGKDYSIFGRLHWSRIPDGTDGTLTELWGCVIDLCSPDGQLFLDAIFGRASDGTPLPARRLDREEHQRPLNLLNVDQMLDGLRHGKWKLTGESAIVSARNGVAISLDFQHRSLVAREGIAAFLQGHPDFKVRPKMPILIVANPDFSVFDVIDSGASRSGRDHLSVLGVPDEFAGELSTACGFLLSRLEGNGKRYSRPFAYRVAEIAGANPGLLASVQWALDLEKSARAAIGKNGSGLDDVLSLSHLFGGAAYAATFDYLFSQWDMSTGDNPDCEPSAWMNVYTFDGSFVPELEAAPDDGFGIGLGEQHATRQGAYRSLVQSLVWGKYPSIRFAKKGSVGPDGETEIPNDCWVLSNGKAIASLKELIEQGPLGGHRDAYRRKINNALSEKTTIQTDRKLDCIVPLIVWALAGKEPEPIVTQGKRRMTAQWPMFRPTDYLSDRRKKTIPEDMPIGMNRLGGFDLPETARKDFEPTDE